MSELALQLIRENKAKQKAGESATFLDLGYTGLKEIPDELFDLVWLETLILSNQYSVWDEFKREWIDHKSPNNGSSNFIKKLPQEFTKLNQLKTLYAAGDEEYKWNIKDVSALKAMMSLEQLYLSRNKLSKCDNLRNLKNLKFLEVDSNDLEDINFVVELENLRSLSISENKILDINSVAQLKKLEFLYFGDTKVKNLEVLRKLPNLTRLNVAKNSINLINSIKLQNIFI